MEAEKMIAKSKTWKTIYPHYLDSTLSQAEGRRVSKKIAVPNITIQEMADALQKIRVPTVVEVHKSYPRDSMIKGRVKVMIFDEDHHLVNSSVLSKKVLLARICATIKESAERIKNPNGKPHPSRIANESSKMEEEKKEIVAQQTSKDKQKGKKGRK